MQNDRKQINIDEIMQQIRTEIKQKGYNNSMLDFEEIPFAQEISHAENHFQLASLQQSAEYLNIRNQIEPYKPVEGNFLVVWIKKILRKLIKFYIMPIMTEQNALNLHTANSVNQIQQYIISKSDSDQINLTELVSRIETLELKQSANKQEIQALRSQIKALTAENEQLRRKK
ncbi:MAG: hypothetical protein K2J88_04550 [Oscillospiraceae bacterium]|nr:hypothetical protein [Oscillospiraceae bacterium]